MTVSIKRYTIKTFISRCAYYPPWRLYENSYLV